MGSLSAGGPPAKLLTIPSADADVELIFVDNVSSRAYTSLKDIIPALPLPVPMSPAAGANKSWEEIPIRNRLVKQAAWAYLQPMAASQQSAAGGVLCRVCSKITGVFRPHFAAGYRLLRCRVVPAISRVFGCLLGVLFLGGHRER